MKTKLVKAYITRPLNRHERNLEIQQLTEDDNSVYVKYTYENHDYREMKHQVETLEVKIKKSDLKEYKKILKADNATRWSYRAKKEIISRSQHMVDERYPARVKHGSKC